MGLTGREVPYRRAANGAISHEDHSMPTESTTAPARGHSVTVDHGWIEVADASLAWLRSNGL